MRERRSTALLLASVPASEALLFGMGHGKKVRGFRLVSIHNQGHDRKYVSIYHTTRAGKNLS
jgi:hypothetical protein